MENTHKWRYNYWKKFKTLRQKEKLLVLSNFFFCYIYKGLRVKVTSRWPKIPRQCHLLYYIRYSMEPLNSCPLIQSNLFSFDFSTAETFVLKMNHLSFYHIVYNCISKVVLQAIFNCEKVSTGDLRPGI